MTRDVIHSGPDAFQVIENWTRHRMIRIEVPVTTCTSFPVAKAKEAIEAALLPYDALRVAAGEEGNCEANIKERPQDPRDPKHSAPSPSPISTPPTSILQPSGMFGRVLRKMKRNDSGVITASTLIQGMGKTLFRYVASFQVYLKVSSWKGQ